MARIDRHSDTWQRVAAWAEQRRAMATADLIVGGTTPGYDDKLRGEIRALGDLLTLADEPDPPATPIDY